MRNLGSFRYRGPAGVASCQHDKWIQTINDGCRLRKHMKVIQNLGWNFSQVYDFDVPCTDSAIVMSRSALALLSQHASCKTLRHNFLQIWIGLLSDAEFKIQGLPESWLICSDREAPKPRNGGLRSNDKIYLTDRKGRVAMWPNISQKHNKAPRLRLSDHVVVPTFRLQSSFWTLASQDMSVYGLQCHIPGLLRTVHSCPVDSCPRISLPSWECRRGGH